MLCLADITTVSVFVCEISALGVYEIGSFLCSSLWRDTRPLSPATPSSCELPKVYLAGALVLFIFLIGLLFAYSPALTLVNVFKENILHIYITQRGILLLNLYVMVEFILAFNYFLYGKLSVSCTGCFILFVLFLPLCMLGTVLRLAVFNEVCWFGFFFFIS